MLDLVDVPGTRWDVVDLVVAARSGYRRGVRAIFEGSVVVGVDPDGPAGEARLAAVLDPVAVEVVVLLPSASSASQNLVTKASPSSLLVDTVSKAPGVTGKLAEFGCRVAGPGLVEVEKVWPVT